MAEPRELVCLDRARIEIAACMRVNDAKNIRDKAIAAQTYARKIGLSKDAQNDLGEIIVEASVRAGELLAETVNHAGGRPSKTGKPSQRASVLPPDITWSDSSRWQAVATVPDGERRKFYASTRERGAEITLTGALKLAKAHAIGRKVARILLDADRTEGPDVLSTLSDGAGQYRCIYLDPPWQYDDAGCDGAAAKHYPTMSIDALSKLPVGRLAHPDGAHFWMWTTWPMIRDRAPHAVLESWGLRWVGEFVWDKKRMGLGHWLRGQTEILILAVSGEMKLLRKNQSNHVSSPRLRHSQKPEVFRKLIEGLSPGPRVELFARRAVKGWSRWGNQA